MKHVRAVLALLCALTLTSLAACGSGSSEPAAQGAPAKLKIGSTPSVAAAPLFLAQAKGYFRDEGLDIEIVNALGTDAQNLTAVGQLDGYFGALSATYFNGVANGQDVSIVGEGGLLSADGRAPIELLVRKDSGIDSPADLRGKKVVVPCGEACASGWQVNRLLGQGGLSTRDVEVTRLSLDDGPVAVVNKQVDATLATYPALGKLLAAGDLKTVGNMADAYALGGSAFWTVGPNLTVTNRDVGARYLRALQRAVTTDLQGAYMQNADTVNALSSATGIPADVIRQVPAPSFPTGFAVSTDAIDQMQSFFRERGVLTYPQNIPVADLVDTELTKAAAAKTS